MSTDELLLAGWGADGFTAVFDRHCDRVLTHCSRRLGSREDGKDAMASVFLQAWVHIHKIRYVNGSALPWLLVVGTNVTSKMVRTQLRQRRRWERTSHEIAYDDFADSVAASVDASRRIGNIDDLIAELPQREQVVVSLCDLGGLSQAEAASVLRVPLGTIKSRLSRAHHKLRVSLARQTSSTGVPEVRTVFVEQAKGQVHE